MWYRIDDVDRLDPFLISVVAPDDQWMYVSSSGALTAGRRTAEHALFPYETDDRLHRSGGLTGPVTMIRVTGLPEVWEPFAPWVAVGDRRRSLAKSATGDRLRFEEHDPASGLTFRATWASAGSFGLVRRCELLVEDGHQPIEVELVDGLLDVLPAGVDLADQQAASTLVDAYRRSELDDETGLAVFALEARISDRADPAESLTATVVWSRGLPDSTVTLSDRQLRHVRDGATLRAEHLVAGRKGSYLESATAVVSSDAPLLWFQAADVDQDHVAISALRRRLLETEDLAAEVELAIDESTDQLVSLVAEADGLQATADPRTTVHHFANTMFNIMRGGVFPDDHRVVVADVARFIDDRNRPALVSFTAATAELEPVIELDDLRSATAGNPDLTRLVAEYLPLVWSRRHGDPSRPWNRFSIPAPDPDGHPARGYEGNWRDIFQNWEALVHSFPGYAESVVAVFLNASTLDGHNPYRITDRGVDWELPEPGSWGNFGYWGDHQIVYLHRLLDAAERFHPGRLAARLDEQAFSSADVPYRLVPYADLVADPKRTLVFDEAGQAAVEKRVAEIGTDGRLVTTGTGVHHATLAEKLLLPALAKLSNLVAGAGIWMNTQRPEWNDANNALVGIGVSTVTLVHLRDYLALVDQLLDQADGEVRIGEAAMTWIEGLTAAFEGQDPIIGTGAAGDADRRALLDVVGLAYEAYRTTIADAGPGAAVPVEVASLRRLVTAAGPHLDHAMAAASRDDGLVHAYWLLRLEPGTASIEPLPEMLEGQAAVLGSPSTGAEAAVALVDALVDSELHRPDQDSFVLYPNRPPRPFLDKNRVPEELVGPGMLAVLDAGTGLLRRDADGTIRFAAELHSARHLAAALEDAAADPANRPMIEHGRAEIETAYEAVFRHRAFTGRSGTMYRYEGLGSIYWHMVSKVLAGIQERALVEADQAGAGGDQELLAALIDRYRLVRSGLGFMKPVAQQGAFPTDPHSHTPAHAGAQQPGMTGQVKEGVLLRFGELGVRIAGGRARFRPVLLDPDEFLTAARPWSPLGPDGRLDAGTLGFTYCGVPIIYRLVADGEAGVQVTWSDGRVEHADGAGELGLEASRALLARTGLLDCIEVAIASTSLRATA